MSKDNNMQNSYSRPQISQEVIKGFTAIVDAQDEKGFAKYGRSIDDANDADYDWKLMALEECADHAKYLVREIKRLEARNNQHENALYALLNMSYEDGLDVFIDIIVDTLLDHRLADWYKEDAAKGKAQLKELLEGVGENK
ncbi:hypothetical protein K7T73_12655 [Bacillus badius]|uniref:hypothetical protein n=1 Tax=Bacillus badius TaxID=1455 RepID=UPI001CBD339E|nr:hypothetical protein [Bacillus badius]UAT29450.1 hypothetical protein K7T73_12655 [Bacillus badius]